MDSVESYEAAFERIKEITGEEEIDMLVNRFIEVEDRNFALFNYVNEQNNQIEMLQEQIMEVSNNQSWHVSQLKKEQFNYCSKHCYSFIFRDGW